MNNLIYRYQALCPQQNEHNLYVEQQTVKVSIFLDFSWTDMDKLGMNYLLQ